MTKKNNQFTEHRLQPARNNKALYYILAVIIIIIIAAFLNRAKWMNLASYDYNVFLADKNSKPQAITIADKSEVEVPKTILNTEESNSIIKNSQPVNSNLNFELVRKYIEILDSLNQIKINILHDKAFSAELILLTSNINMTDLEVYFRELEDYNNQLVLFNSSNHEIDMTGNVIGKLFSPFVKLSKNKVIINAKQKKQMLLYLDKIHSHLLSDQYLHEYLNNQNSK